MSADDLKQCSVLLQQKEFSKAYNLASELTFRFPNSVESLKLSFDTSIAMGKLEEAEIMLNRLGKSGIIDQQRLEIYAHIKQLGEEFQYQNYKKCIEHIATLRAIGFKPSIYLIKIWIICMAKESQDLEQVKMELDTALTGMPASSNGLYLKGLVSYHQGKLKESLELLKQVLEIDPHDDDALNLRSNVETDMMKLEQADTLRAQFNRSDAIKIYTSIIEDNKRQPEMRQNALISRAKCFFELGKFYGWIDDSIAALKMSIAPDDIVQDSFKCASEQGKLDAIEAAVAENSMAQVNNEIGRHLFNEEINLFNSSLSGNKILAAVGHLEAAGVLAEKRRDKKLASLTSRAESIDLTGDETDDDLLYREYDLIDHLNYDDPLLEKRILTLVREAESFMQEANYDKAMDSIQEAISMSCGEKNLSSKIFLIFLRGKIQFHFKEYYIAHSDFMQTTISNTIFAKSVAMHAKCLNEIGKRCPIDGQGYLNDFHWYKAKMSREKKP